MLREAAQEIEDAPGQYLLVKAETGLIRLQYHGVAYLEVVGKTIKSQINQLLMLIKEVFRAAYADGTIARDPTAALVKPLRKQGIDQRRNKGRPEGSPGA